MTPAPDMSNRMLLLLWVVLVGGCAPKFTVHVDALAAPNASAHRTYVLLPGEEGLHQGDLLYAELAATAERALGRAGFRAASAETPADVAIFLSYGFDDPYTVHTVRTETSATSAPVHLPALPTAGRPAIGAGFGATSEYRTGFDDVETRTTVSTSQWYPATARLTAHSLAGDGEAIGAQLWSTSAELYGTARDLRRFFPLLMAAVEPWLAEQTDSRVSVQIREKDDQVAVLRGQAPDSDEPAAPPSETRSPFRSR
jgi:hypothetical protein